VKYVTNDNDLVHSRQSGSRGQHRNADNGRLIIEISARRRRGRAIAAKRECGRPGGRPHPE